MKIFLHYVNTNNNNNWQESFSEHRRPSWNDIPVPADLRSNPAFQRSLPV